jgi:hypothetical protein
MRAVDGRARERALREAARAKRELAERQRLDELVAAEEERKRLERIARVEQLAKIKTKK